MWWKTSLSGELVIRQNRNNPALSKNADYRIVSQQPNICDLEFFGDLDTATATHGLALEAYNKGDEEPFLCNNRRNTAESKNIRTLSEFSE